MAAVLETRAQSPIHSMQWHLTNKCQNRCKHCYMHVPDHNQKLEHELTFSEAVNLFDSIYLGALERKKVLNIAFTGGDPLLFDGFFDLLQHVSGKAGRLSILGNPNLIDTKTAKRLANFGIQSYQLSLDGTKKTHEFLRSSGSFNSTLDAAKRLKSVGISVHIMMTLNNHNFKELPDLMEVVAKEGIDLFSFARICSVGSGALLGGLSEITPEKYKMILYNYHETSIQLKRKGYSTYFAKKDHLFALLYADLGIVPNINEFRENGCGVGLSTCILPDGEIYACRRFDSPLGNATIENYWDIYEGENLLAYTDWNNFIKCSNCPLIMICRGCPAVSHSESRNFYGPDPHCWSSENK